MSTPHSIPELVMAWGRGRGHSRITAPPESVDGGFRVAVGPPSPEVREVFHTYTPESLAAAARRLDEPGRQIMIAGPPELLASITPSTWTMDDAGHLMTVTFDWEPYEVAAEYRLLVETEGPLTVARVFHRNGDLAGSARLGRDGAFGVFDKVVTAPAHRRRGIGSLMMRALSASACAQGMRYGLLVGSDDGRALYERLGWAYVSAFPGARSKPE